MPLGKENLNVNYHEEDNTIVKLSTLQREIEVASVVNASRASLALYPYFVQKVQTSNIVNTSDLSSIISNGEYAVLVGQTIASQNGYYYQSGGTSTKQSLISNHDAVFVDVVNGDTAIYHKELDTYVQVYYDVFDISYEFTTSSTNTVTLFNVPTIKDKSSNIKLIITGYETSDYSIFFNGEYQRLFYNNSGTLVNSTAFMETITKNSDFTEPTVAFLITGTQPHITLTPGGNATKWMIKGTIYMR